MNGYDWRLALQHRREDDWTCSCGTRDCATMIYLEELTAWAGHQRAWDVAFDAIGTPAPQGSMRPMPIGGKTWKEATGAVLVQDNKRTKPWRKLVQDAGLDAMAGRGPILDPVAVAVQFRFPRPQSHFRSGRFAGQLKPDAPRWHAQAPDLSKLVRAMEDALIDVVWHDDRLISRYVLLDKVWANPGERIGLSLAVLVLR